MVGNFVSVVYFFERYAVWVKAEAGASDEKRNEKREREKELERNYGFFSFIDAL